MRVVTLLAFFFLIPTILVAHPLGHEFLPIEHWAYEALQRFETRGLVRLPSEKPFSRPAVVRFARHIEKQIVERGVILSDRDRFNLDRLNREFRDRTAQEDPKQRYDPAWITSGEAPVILEMDADVTLAPTDPETDTRWAFFGIARPSTRIHIGPYVTYEVQYQLTMGPERDSRVRDAKPSPRERSFKGLTSLFERSYIVANWKQATAFWGRDFVDWGSSDGGNLLVSQTAGTLDKFGAIVNFKNFRLSTFQALLSGDPERRLGGHRFEYWFERGALGVSETVLYVDRGIDLIYLFPLSSYYANQFNERSDDNVMWSFDLKYKLRSGLQVYGTLMIDDFQFERDDGTPDKVAFDLGFRAAVNGPLAMSVEGRYLQVDIYTYSHRDSLKAHIAGTGSIEQGEPFLGADLPPDSDMYMLRVNTFPVGEVTLGGEFSIQRRGEGSDFRRFKKGLDPAPAFPSGVVERRTAFGLLGRWELPRNSAISIAASRIRVRNAENRQGDDRWLNAFRLDATWDL